MKYDYDRFLTLQSAKEFIRVLNDEDDSLIQDLIKTAVHDVCDYCNNDFKESVPPPINHWLKVRVATLYEYREEFIVGTIIGHTPHMNGVLNRYRIRSF